VILLIRISTQLYLLLTVANGC